MMPYFSGTGNSEYVAKRIAGRIGDKKFHVSALCTKCKKCEIRKETIPDRTGSG